MLNKVIGLFVAVLVWGTTGAVAGQERDAGTGPLRVGIIAPLTGGVANWGKSVRTAIELANGESDQPAELFFEDEETCSPMKALTSYNFLRSAKKG